MRDGQVVHAASMQAMAVAGEESRLAVHVCVVLDLLATGAGRWWWRRELASFDVTHRIVRVAAASADAVAPSETPAEQEAAAAAAVAVCVQRCPQLSVKRRVLGGYCATVALYSPPPSKLQPPLSTRTETFPRTFPQILGHTNGSEQPRQRPVSGGRGPKAHPRPRA